MGSVRTGIFFAGILLFWVGFLDFFTPPALSAEVETTIDISYSLVRENKYNEITTTRTLDQKYTLEYDTSLNYFYDFAGIIGFRYLVEKETADPAQKSMNPIMTLSLESDSLTASFDYSGLHEFTDSSPTRRETNIYTNEYLFEMGKKQSKLPELKLGWGRRHEFELQQSEKVEEGMYFEMKHTINDLEVGSKYLQKTDRKIIDHRRTTDDVNWTSTVSYGRSFSKLLDLQIDYLIEEDISTRFGNRNVFEKYDKDYDQEISTSLKSSYTVLKDMKLDFAYDYKLTQDFMKEDNEFEIIHKIKGSMEKALLSWSKVKLEYEGTNEKHLGAGEKEDEQVIDGMFSGLLSVKPVSWLDIKGTSEREWETKVEELTGRSLGTVKKNRYEIDAQAIFPGSLKISAIQGIEEEYENDLLLKDLIKYKFQGTYKPIQSLSIEPLFEIELDKEYDLTYFISEIYTISRIWNAQLKLVFKKGWRDIIDLNASYIMGYTMEQELDSMLDMAVEKASLNEETLVNLKFTNIVRGLTVETEVTSKTTDDNDDEEPIVVDRTLMANIEWEIRNLKILYKYQFDDKGDADNTLSVGLGLTWKGELCEITGEYIHDETFAEETKEKDQYNLKFLLAF